MLVYDVKLAEFGDSEINLPRNKGEDQTKRATPLIVERKGKQNLVEAIYIKASVQPRNHVFGFGNRVQFFRVEIQESPHRSLQHDLHFVESNLPERDVQNDILIRPHNQAGLV